MSRKWPEAPHTRLQTNRIGSNSGVPRPFLPPSYYAAAGGIPYPRQQTGSKERKDTPSSEGADRFTNDRIPRPRPPPPSIPPASESESSFEVRPKEPSHKLSGDVKSALSMRASTSTSTKRQGLPNVEAQLLPSLQSTIHRMTRPPSRVLADSTNTTHFDNQNDDLKRKSTRHPSHTGPHPGVNEHASQDTPPKSRIPQKSALKSALRTPVTKATPILADSPQTSAASSPRRNSLRSVKSLLSRKLGNAPTPPSELVSPHSRSDAPSSSSTMGYVRTGASHPSKSHLPRPKFKLEHKSPTPSSTHSQLFQQHASAHTDESDIENKYQRQWMDRRRLTVANAEVIPSASSSDGSVDSSFNNLRTPKLGSYSQRPEWTPKIQNRGLGFDVHSPSTNLPTSPLLPNVEFPGERDRTKILRFSLPPSGSDASLYSNHHLSYPGSWDEHSDFAMEQEGVASDYQSPEVSRSEKQAQASSGFNREYWGDELSGSSSEDFQSEERLDLHATGGKAKDYRSDDRGWEDGSSTPLASSYKDDVTERQTSLPKPASHRVVPRDYDDASHQPSPSSRPFATDRGHQWKTPMPTPMAGHSEVSNAWFNESSGDLEDEFEHIPLTPRRRAPVPPRFESSSLSLQSKHQAAQQREAFGIPPSPSDEANFNRAQRWSQSDSYRSSVTSTRWECEEPPVQENPSQESFSLGAENMLKTLHPEWTRNMPAMSAASSTASFYEDQADTFETAQEEAVACDRRNEDERNRQDRRHHESREDIILDFLQSEENFLSNTQICVDLFILPIRTQDSRSWIGGVPAVITRLLDWYEDIVNLHLAIYQSLESSAAMQESHVVISGLANYLGEFVSKLHVYQPYLVNLADVLEEIAFLVSDLNSDFGEFMRIQEKSLKAMGWTFERLLMEPVNRLAAYQDLFSSLLESTPQDHPEFLTTMMLSRSADTVMRVMTEVKVRETEHRLIQSLAAQISDPAVSAILASRERRLLHSGTLRLVSPSVNITPSGVLLQSQHQVKAQKRSRRLVQAITHWDRKPERSSSTKSTASSVTASLQSFNTTSSYGPPASLDSQSARLPLLRGLFKGKTSGSAFSSVPSSQGLGLETSSVSPGSVQVFVFSDIALMVLPKPTVAAKSSLVPKVGLARVFSVSQGSETPPNELRIQTVPVNPDSVKNDLLPRFATITEVVLRLPDSDCLGSGEDSSAAEGQRDPWILAFERCSQDTLQLLSCPGPRKAVPSERSKDTWLAVSSLVSSGLPMPKSPSGNLPDLQYGLKEEEARKVEREERGWWSLRYQQVLGEIVHPMVELQGIRDV